MRIAEHRATVDALLARRDLVVRQTERERTALREAKETVDATEKAQVVVQRMAQRLQRRAHGKIANVVSRCLNAVFDDPYEFRIDFERKRGKTEARMVFVRDGVELDDPLNEIGGGVVDVAALALRLACVLTVRPVRRRLLVLDEPWSHIRGEGNKSRTRRMLTALAEEMGVQFILSTDIPAYRLGKVVELV